MMWPQIKSYATEKAIIGMDAEQLEIIVSRVLAEPVTVPEWQVTLLGSLESSPMAGGVYRVEGSAVTRTKRSRSWCVAVKILRSPEGLTMPDGTTITREMAETPNNFAYWQRELLVAQSDLLVRLPAGLRAPHFLGVTYISECECWLWQECLPEDHEWTWADYREAAFRLGHWQGTAVSQHLNHPWLSQNWLATWVHGPLTNIFGLVEGMNGYGHPLLTAYFAPEELAAVRQLWANRQIYIDRLGQLPKTICHLDAYRANMVWQDNELVLLDWAFVGEGAVGEELAAFVGATLLLDHVPLADAEQLEEVAFAGYLAGLRTGGWSGGEALVWEAYHCAMSLRYALMSLASMLRTAVQPGFAAEWEQKSGKSLDDILAHRAGLVRFYLSRLEEKQHDLVIS